MAAEVNAAQDCMVEVMVRPSIFQRQKIIWSTASDGSGAEGRQRWSSPLGRLQHCSQISLEGWHKAGRRRVTCPHSSCIAIAPRPHGVRAVTARLRRSRGRGSVSSSMIMAFPPASP
jgi:hypothetical protein